MIFNIFTYYISFYLTFKLLSIFEKSFIINKKQTSNILDNKSYLIFKYGRNIIFLIASFEIYYFNISINDFSVFLLFIFIFGMYMRIISIITLGEFWSFKVEKRKNHKIITDGIYKYIKHPAYIGNIYIPSFYFMLGLNFSATISIIFIIVFYIIRTHTEDKLLNEIKNKNK